MKLYPNYKSNFKKVQIKIKNKLKLLKICNNKLTLIVKKKMKKLKFSVLT